MSRGPQKYIHIDDDIIDEVELPTVFDRVHEVLWENFKGNCVWQPWAIKNGYCVGRRKDASKGIHLATDSQVKFCILWRDNQKWYAVISAGKAYIWTSNSKESEDDDD